MLTCSKEFPYDNYAHQPHADTVLQENSDVSEFSNPLRLPFSFLKDVAEVRPPRNHSTSSKLPQLQTSAMRNHPKVVRG